MTIDRETENSLAGAVIKRIALQGYAYKSHVEGAIIGVAKERGVDLDADDKAQLYRRVSDGLRALGM